MSRHNGKVHTTAFGQFGHRAFSAALGQTRQQVQSRWFAQGFEQSRVQQLVNRSAAQRGFVRLHACFPKNAHLRQCANIPTSQKGVKLLRYVPLGEKPEPPADSDSELSQKPLDLKNQSMAEKRPSSTANTLYPGLLEYLTDRAGEFELIPTDRQSDLATVAGYIRDQRSQSELAKLIFICTHNSRRSHLAQIWTQVAAAFYGIEGIETFSGGTEATAFNPRAVAALQRCGLKIIAPDPLASNPRYAVHHSDSGQPQICYSKIYDAPPNPTQGYCAVMTCSQADDACPLVMGCDLRMPIRYEDPKVADDTEFEAQKYDERAAQICREMLYLISCV